MLVDTVTGIIDMFRHPINTAKGIAYAFSHPVQTEKGIWQAITDSWERDVVHGNAESRGRWLGNVATQIVLSLVGTKGVDKLSKLSAVSKLSKAAKMSKIGQAARISERLNRVQEVLQKLRIPQTVSKVRGAVSALRKTILQNKVAAKKFEIKTALKSAEKCFAYQPTPEYFASIKLSNCFYSPDKGSENRGDNKGNTGSSTIAKTEWLSEADRTRITQENLEKYGEESKSKKVFSPAPDAGTVKDGPDNKKILVYYDGTERAILNSEYAGKEVTIKVNGDDIKVPFDNNGFPNFSRWTDYETRLSPDQYLLSDGTQFKLLDYRLAKDMETNVKLRSDIDNTFLEVLEKGIGEKNAPGIAKLQKFINKNSIIKDNLTSQEINDLAAGKGSSTIIDKLNKNPKLKEEFLKANRDWVKSGKDPIGYTWHHHQNEGLMQLVKSRVHGNIRHTGGRQIWGGGR
ncbi:HNH endonuclease [Thermoactinomyces daqus]|uniref:HNH endonuclease n=1 Tax=Thermoactinomyces daqus TaxID=1329516 RepID=A0A7W2AJ39_9BACL|nr:HNH endonuclease [Thermoactinomyces daqus]MBA4544396.1 HNH endonuclease [Thermoactinomyces daqus]